MTFLLDTNTLSETRKGDRGDPNVMAWAYSQALERQFLSTITLLEIEIGARRLGRHDHRQGALLRSWIDDVVMPSFHARILPVDIEVAVLCASLHVPDPRPYADALIAATAIMHNLTLVTRNTRDFEGTGVRLFNPWE